MSTTLDASAACDLIRQAAQLIREDPNRTGSLLSFGRAGQLVVTGDMHGNLRNFEKLQRFCNLPSNPGRFVILHELIHRELETTSDDDSIELLLRAVAWKVEHPDNVFFLQSNHELAQLRGQEITKGGRSVLLDFRRGVEQRFGEKTDDVLAALNEYIAALPLAARAENGLFVAHSLPDPLLIDSFDPNILTRDLVPRDLSPGGDAYALVWGRFHTPRDVEKFAEKVQAKVIVVGHTPQEDGYRVIGRMIILASDHAHGVFLPIDLSREPDVEQLERQIRKFVAIE